MKRIIAVCLTAFALAGCAPHQQYRTERSLCSAPESGSQCDAHAMQALKNDSGQEYWLNFIEFDDQGQLWQRKQMDDVLTRLDAAQEHLLIVVFVHGWKHSAEPGDANIETFKKVLSKLAAAEAYRARIGGSPARRVAGVYLGWRGSSVTFPGAKELTFWARKSTAQRVGAVGVSEVLSRIELVQRTKGTVLDGPNSTRVAVVGHSFGGAVVYTALAHILQNRFISSAGPDGLQSAVVGFGNLVVLINPAFEASLYAPLSDMSFERNWYSPAQLPTLAILTSEADYATRYAFPAGRSVSTIFEYDREVERVNRTTRATERIDTGVANRSAIGHFEPYRTHTLYPVEHKARASVPALSVENSAEIFKVALQAWRDDVPGSKIPFGELTLERTPNSAGRNPCMVIYVDGELIDDHNDIDDQRIVEFLKQLISISATGPGAAALSLPK
ncbi:MAG TPA: alpha/beta fold hydrolase [Burkholderiales bacterium]|nr:alpha/beta fold hydrolase [Burkholderiales bacterium]